MTPPDLIMFGGEWAVYEAELYRIFKEEIAGGSLMFCHSPVKCRRLPEAAGRWASFWHLVQEGRVEDDRTPDLRRCERIRWVRWVIENAADHSEIDIWQNTRNGRVSRLLWFREEYLVVLAERTGYWLLLTAYCTDKSGRIKQLRKERDVFLRAHMTGVQND
ncbi:hypothetical protein JCM17846_19610 [Iodidimonas nitroreducens]|uniref:Uncharacterized protein n=1 Tax=Iodidimonas nitroreducens TaxID=1236968 RepID=A0A5A7NB62_9PROT|nr:hypothetical protein [Iodidimonas nitroreducens]GAK33174.1 hypothetical protein AQ1_01059 [alpha proteobacterium Q-1]GER04279.1 hypothetical protein JCM17846_19610 [Iodidimonas nitroreducens]